MTNNGEQQRTSHDPSQCLALAFALASASLVVIPEGNLRFRGAAGFLGQPQRRRLIQKRGLAAEVHLRSRTTPFDLKTRHKTGLFSTAAIAGASLILGGTARETCGTVILGLAFTWAYGSGSSGLRWCLTVSALALAFTPVTIALIDHHKQVEHFDQTVASLQARSREFTIGDPGSKPTNSPQDSKVVTVPDGRWEPVPQQRTDSQRGDVFDQAAREMASTPPDPPPALQLSSTLTDSALFEVPCALIALLFFGSLLSDRRTTAQQTGRD